MPCTDCDLPVFCTFSFDTHGRTSMGIRPAQAAQTLSQMGVSAVGANCGHAPEEVLELLPLMHEAAPDAYLIAKPNAGIPRMVKRQVVYDADPARMAGLARQYVGSRRGHRRRLLWLFAGPYRGHGRGCS